MPPTARKLGPGQLELGAAALEVNAQLTACRLEASESVTTTEDLKVLSGEVIDGAESAEYSFTLTGTFLQDDPGVASVVDWSWANMGTEQPFRFVPVNVATGREVSGTLVPVPLSIGGDDVDGDYMASDFSWRIKGIPVPGLWDQVGGSV